MSPANLWFTDKKGRRFMSYAVPIVRESSADYAPWLDSRATRFSIEYRDHNGNIRRIWNVRQRELTPITLAEMVEAAVTRSASHIHLKGNQSHVSH